MLTIIRSYLGDECGASAAEYALILAIVGAGIAAAVFVLGGTISKGIGRAANCISNASNAGC